MNRIKINKVKKKNQYSMYKGILAISNRTIRIEVGCYTAI